jgi:hypothetical protein
VAAATDAVDWDPVVAEDVHMRRVSGDEDGKPHPTADEYRNWGSDRAAVIVWIVILLIIGGIIAWLVLSGHWHGARSGGGTVG